MMLNHHRFKNCIFFPDGSEIRFRRITVCCLHQIQTQPKPSGFFKVLLAEVTAASTTGFAELSQNLTHFFCVVTGAENFKQTGDDTASAHDPAKNSRMNGKADSAAFGQFIAGLVAGTLVNTRRSPCSKITMGWILRGKAHAGCFRLYTCRLQLF